MKLIWNWKTYFKGRSRLVGGEGGWRRRWEGKGRRSLPGRLLLVDLSQFILMWFLWTDNCHQDNSFSSQSLSLSHSLSLSLRQCWSKASAEEENCSPSPDNVSLPWRFLGFTILSHYCSTPWKLLKTGWSPTGCTSIWRGLPPRGSWSLPGQSACCWQV